MGEGNKEDGPLEGVSCSQAKLQPSPDQNLRTGRTYKIYQQDIHEIDMYTHLCVWRKHLEMRVGHVPEGKAYLFPFISPTGDPHIYKPMSYEKAQAQITAFAAEAGLSQKFTTHCFRRGGAQYRFMYAPPGDRWCLNMIRWWGGWAENEKVGTPSHISHQNPGWEISVTDNDFMIRLIRWCDIWSILCKHKRTVMKMLSIHSGMTPRRASWVNTS